MDRLAGKVAVVTGAAFGNGRGIALRFAEEGADLVLADVDGVVQLVRSFAVACGRHGITCNAIAPGYIETAMTRRSTENPLLHASFLASDAAGFVSGEVVFTDGGLTAGMYSAAAETVRAAAAAE